MKLFNSTITYNLLCMNHEECLIIRKPPPFSSIKDNAFIVFLQVNSLIPSLLDNHKRYRELIWCEWKSNNVISLNAHLDYLKKNGNEGNLLIKRNLMQHMYRKRMHTGLSNYRMDNASKCRFGMGIELNPAKKMPKPKSCVHRSALFVPIS